MERNEARRESRKTWKSLKLRTEFRSALQRRKAQEDGKYRVIGGDAAERPFRKVPSHRYYAVRREIAGRWAEAHPPQPQQSLDAWRSQWQQEVELATYEHFANEARRSFRSSSGLGDLEMKLLDDAARLAPRSSTADPAVTRPCSDAIAEVLTRIRQTQADGPARLRQAWTEVVGSEIASQSQLERVDAATGTAWFRCFNSALTHHLSRKHDLALALGRKLGLKLRQLRSCA